MFSLIRPTLATLSAKVAWLAAVFHDSYYRGVSNVEPMWKLSLEDNDYLEYIKVCRDIESNAEYDYASHIDHVLGNQSIAGFLQDVKNRSQETKNSFGDLTAGKYGKCATFSSN